LSAVDKTAFDSVVAARRKIEEAGKPQPLDKLFDHIRTSGFRINTNKPRSTFGARLRDYSGRVGIIYLKGNGWWLSDRPYKPASYSLNSPTGHGDHAG